MEQAHGTAEALREEKVCLAVPGLGLEAMEKYLVDSEEDLGLKEA